MLEAVIRRLVWYLLTLFLGRRNPVVVKRVCTRKYTLCTMSEPNDMQFFKDRYLVKGCSPLLCSYWQMSGGKERMNTQLLSQGNRREYLENGCWSYLSVNITVLVSSGGTWMLLASFIHHVFYSKLVTEKGTSAVHTCINTLHASSCHLTWWHWFHSMRKLKTSLLFLLWGHNGTLKAAAALQTTNKYWWWCCKNNSCSISGSLSDLDVHTKTSRQVSLYLHAM